MWICDIITSPMHGCIYICMWFAKGCLMPDHDRLAVRQWSGFVRIMAAKTAFGTSLFKG